jgi:hypothetical protein
MTNKIKTFYVLLILLVLPVVLKAQFISGDTINTCHIKVSSTTHGVSILNNLDTYLSGYNYSGVGYNYNHENFRDARIGEHKFKYQTLFNGIIGVTELYDSKQYTLLLKRMWSGYHPFKINERLQLLAGAQIQLAGGALYIPTNGNNLVSAKLHSSLAATGMAIYKIPLRTKKITTRYQIDIPLVGVAFSPAFGQSYYEIFGLGNYNNILHLIHPFNAPSWRHTLSADVPIGKKHCTTLRASYIADIFQSEINELRTHIYNHTFSIGVVKTLYKIKEGTPLKIYSPY